ncbi:hypothetical protein [Celeribacter arenosi]
MKLRLSLPLLAAITLSLTAIAPAQAQQKSDPRPVSDGFADAYLNWERGDYGFFRWAVFNNNGKIELCGAFATKGTSVGFRFTKAAMAEARLMADGKSVLRGISFFKSRPNKALANKLFGEPANCRITKTDYPAGKVAFQLKFRDGAYSVSK